MSWMQVWERCGPLQEGWMQIFLSPWSRCPGLLWNSLSEGKLSPHFVRQKFIVKLLSCCIVLKAAFSTNSIVTQQREKFHFWGQSAFRLLSYLFTPFWSTCDKQFEMVNWIRHVFNPEIIKRFGNLGAFELVNLESQVLVSQTPEVWIELPPTASNLWGCDLRRLTWLDLLFCKLEKNKNPHLHVLFFA